MTALSSKKNIALVKVMLITLVTQLTLALTCHSEAHFTSWQLIDFPFYEPILPKVPDLYDLPLSVSTLLTHSDLPHTLPRMLSSYPRIFSGTFPIWRLSSSEHLQAIHERIQEREICHKCSAAQY